jgi:hypothetical protein
MQPCAKQRLADINVPQPRDQPLVEQSSLERRELALEQPRNGLPRQLVPQRLDPQTPLAEVTGIGPKTATRLAALGLLVVRDLVHHYPRDYLDYAHLVRIAALEPGRTATIVATVRRCHAFGSPRNPNLAILELQLQDVTGRLKVTRFFAGRRFSSPGWLKAQQRRAVNLPLHLSLNSRPSRLCLRSRA